MASVGPVGSASKCCLCSSRMPGVQLEGSAPEGCHGQDREWSIRKALTKDNSERRNSGPEGASGGLSEDGVKEEKQVCAACFLGCSEMGYPPCPCLMQHV